MAGMSTYVIRTAGVVCDFCHQAREELGISAAELRANLKEFGWHTKLHGSRDICPACWGWGKR